jgi:hypothetical protein
VRAEMTCRIGMSDLLAPTDNTTMPWSCAVSPCGLLDLPRNLFTFYAAELRLYGGAKGLETPRVRPRGQPVKSRFPYGATKVGFDADSSEEPRWFDVAAPAFGSRY